MATAMINGVRIHYEVYGSGFPLALCQGLGASSREWEPQVLELSGHYRLILWDPRGHGGSESPRDRDQYGPDIAANDLLCLLDHLGVRQAYVGGLSMGGGIATRFAIHHPERVAALLIFDSASAVSMQAGPQAIAMRDKTIILAMTQGMEAVAEFLISSNPNVASRVKRGPEAVRQLKEMYKRLDPVGYSHATWTLMNAPSIAGRVGEIKAPTLVLVGAEDPVLPAATVTHEKIAGSKLVVLPDAGHFSNLDQPEAFNREVLAFLREVDAKRKAAAR